MYDLLKGLRIIEATSFVASPSAGMYLAQLGAEVIRVDHVLEQSEEVALGEFEND